MKTHTDTQKFSHRHTHADTHIFMLAWMSKPMKLHTDTHTREVTENTQPGALLNAVFQTLRTWHSY